MIALYADPFRVQVDGASLTMDDPATGAGAPTWRFRLDLPIGSGGGTIRPIDDQAAALLAGDRAFAARRTLLWAAGKVHGSRTLWSIARTPAP